MDVVSSGHHEDALHICFQLSHLAERTGGSRGRRSRLCSCLASPATGRSRSHSTWAGAGTTARYSPGCFRAASPSRQGYDTTHGILRMSIHAIRDWRNFRWVSLAVLESPSDGADVMDLVLEPKAQTMQHRPHQSTHPPIRLNAT